MYLLSQNIPGVYFGGGIFLTVIPDECLFCTLGWPLVTLPISAIYLWSSDLRAFPCLHYYAYGKTCGKILKNTSGSKSR